MTRATRLPERIEGPDGLLLRRWTVDDADALGQAIAESVEHLRPWMGWVAEDGSVAYEPVAGVASRLRCRGQVTAATRVAAYEISIKEIGYRPEPYVIADATMYADGRPIVAIGDMTLQMTGACREAIEALWQQGHQDARKPAVANPAVRECCLTVKR